MILFAPIALVAMPAVAAIPRIDVAPFVAHEVSEKVHLLAPPENYAGPAIGNVSIIEQHDGYIIVDSGLTAGNGRAIRNYIRARSNKPVKALVITHWHNDHPQGASAIRAAWPLVRIISTRETKNGMLGPALGPMLGLRPTPKHEAEMRKLVAQSTALLDSQIADVNLSEERRQAARRAKKDFAQFVDDYAGTHVVPPTETFDGELLIDDPVVPVRLMFLGRANTAGDAIVWLPKQKILMSGDIVVWPTPYGFFSFPREWVQTLIKIKALGYSTLIPGHGEPQTDTAYIDQVIGSIEDIRAQVGPLAKAGLSLEDVQKKVDFSRYTAVFGTDERRARLFKSYWITPMTENAWKEAKGLPIIQGEGEVTVSKQSKPAR